MDGIVYDKNIFGSHREIDQNGFLRVDSCNITKTQVACYLGREIPGWKDMGLDAEKIYYVLRPEDELRKAVPTFNNLPLTREHIEVDVENVPKDKIVGSLGDHAEYADGYLKNNLIVYDQKDIDLIMSGKKKELSCGYRYTPVREHGTFDGQEYDFVMKDIVGNHVALVKEGRAGHDVVVSDTIDKVKEKFMNLFRKKEVVNDEFKESEHPRAENGQFTTKGGSKNKEETKESKSDLKGKSFKVKLARKPSDLSEVKNLDIDHPNEEVKISETIELSEKDYNDFIKHPLRDYDYLKGKGGYDDDGNRTAVAIRSKGKQTLVVDPSGSTYARYMGILYADDDSNGANDAKLSEKEQEKVGVVMKEFKEGELESGSGEKVTNPKQAIAIALSEADKMAKDKDIPDEQEKPEKAGDKDALVKGEEEMTEEVKEALAEDAKKADEAKEAEDACAKDEGEKKDLEGKEKEAFAEGVDYGEKKEKEEPKKLDSEHESEGTKKADEEKAEEKKEAEDEDKEEDKKEEKKEMAKDSAMAMDIDAIKQAVREEMKADFNARECARKAVRSVVGDVNVMSFDSAEDIYKFACEKAGMDLNDIVSYKDAFKGLTAGRSKLALDASPKCGSNEECFKNIRIA